MELNTLTQLELEHLITLKVNELQDLIEKIDKDTKFKTTVLISASIHKENDIKNGIGQFAKYGDDLDIGYVLTKVGDKYLKIAEAHAKFRIFDLMSNMFDEDDE